MQTPIIFPIEMVNGGLAAQIWLRLDPLSLSTKGFSDFDGSLKEKDTFTAPRGQESSDSRVVETWLDNSLLLGGLIAGYCTK